MSIIVAGEETRVLSQLLGKLTLSKGFSGLFTKVAFTDDGKEIKISKKKGTK